MNKAATTQPAAISAALLLMAPFSTFAAAAEGFDAAASADINWPILTGAAAILLLLFTWWRESRHRRRIEQANARLTRHQQLLNSILDNISEAIYRSSPADGLIFANRSYLRMFRYDSLEDLRSVPRENLYARPEDRARLLRKLEQTGAFQHEEIEYRRKDGATFWGLASSIAIYLPGTQAIDYHVGAITGITDRKQIEAQVRELNQHLERRIAERTAELRASEQIQRATYQISEAIHAADDLPSLYERVHGIIKSLMPADNLFLALHDASTGLFHFDYYVDEVDSPPPPRPMSAGLAAYVFKTGKALLATRESMTDPASEWRLVHGTPSAIWLGVPLIVRGRTLGVMAVQDYRDPQACGEEEKQILTFVAEQFALAIERKRAGQALRESEEKHRALFEASSQGVTLHDEHRFLAVNAAALRVFGLAREEEALGRHPAEFAAPIQPGGQPAEALARQFIAECMARGTARFDWLVRAAGGKETPVEVILTRVQMGGRPLIQAVMHDITDRKKAEAELLKALAREKELSALKTNFVSMVSHEFRTPLGIIMSSVDILGAYLARLEPAEREEHLASIRKNVRRMSSLMEEVLLLSRADAGKLSFTPAPLDLPAFSQRLAEEIHSATGRRCPIRFSVHWPLETAEADERLLRHILANLLTNAVKYSPENSPVDFSLRLKEGRALFQIQDLGIGIPEQDQPWLFNAFHRGRNVGGIPGTGLGLVIVKRCAELHGGAIRLESAPGQGTRIELELPVTRSHPHTAILGIEPPPAPATRA